MSIILPKAVALFKTTLAQSINDSDLIMYLSSALTKDGDELLAGEWYGFVLDKNTVNEEFVIGQVDNTDRRKIINLKRGVSYKDGQTEIPTLKKYHNRGASVEITDAPILPAMVDSFVNAVNDFDIATNNINQSIKQIDYVNVNVANYQVSLNDFGKILKCVYNGNVMIQIDTDSNLGITDPNIMYKFYVLKNNTGQVYVSGINGANINFYFYENLFLNNQMFFILKVGLNNWIVY